MGILVGVAVAVVSSFAFFAFAGGAGATHPEGAPGAYFTCQASVARATLTGGDPIPPVDPLAANPGDGEVCDDDLGGLPDVTIPPPPSAPVVDTTTGQARTEILCASDDPDPLVDPADNDLCDGEESQSYEKQGVSMADVTDTTVTLGDVTIVIQAANTSARARCGPGNVPELSSTSQVANIEINGTAVPLDPIVTGEPNQVIEVPGLLKITLNERIGQEGPYPDDATEGFVTRRAVHIEVLDAAPATVADVVIAESTADFHGDVCPEGRIVVKKETAPDENPNSTVFNFASPGLTPASFDLADDGERVFTEVQPGPYTITEGPPTNDYVLTAINCVDNRTDNSTSSVQTRTAAIDVGPGETVTCTFINAKPPPGVCPTGSTPNQAGECIIDAVSCPTGSTLTNGVCIINTTTCPTGSTRPDPAGPCVVTNPICPAGSTPNGQGQCVITTPNCPEGSTRPVPNGPCVVTTPNCPPGSTPSGNQCINDTISCPPGSTPAGNQCVVTRPECPAGATRNPQGQCVISNVQCPAGTTFNPTTLGCSSAPLGGTLVPIPRIQGLFPASPCIGQGFGVLVGIVGTNGDDRITGTNTSDRIFALGGNDRVSGGRGDDCVEGGSGRDTIDGSNGNDVMLGASGGDQIVGGPGRDRMEGGSGRDVLSGASGNDTMRGGGGKDRLNGGYGNDRLVGGSGNDGIHTGNGRDVVNAGSGNDIINAATRGPAARVNCGPGKDRVRINKNERHRTRGCEFVDITTRIKGRGTPRRR